MNLANRLELELTTVLALPKASNRGFTCRVIMHNVTVYSLFSLPFYFCYFCCWHCCPHSLVPYLWYFAVEVALLTSCNTHQVLYQVFTGLRFASTTLPGDDTALRGVGGEKTFVGSLRHTIDMWRQRDITLTMVLLWNLRYKYKWISFQLLIIICKFAKTFSFIHFFVISYNA